MKQETLLPGVQIDEDPLLRGLNKNQIQAVTTTSGIVVTKAEAGSGKTRVLTRRIARRIQQGETDPRRALALTFTNKAAHELRSRVQQLGLRDSVPTGTFHSIALQQVKQRWQEKNISAPTLIPNKNIFLTKHLPKKYKPYATATANESSWANARMISAEHYPAMAKAEKRQLPVDYRKMSELLHLYTQAKYKKRVLDFEDILLQAVRNIHEDPVYAATIQWKHRHFYVDEFQDINPLQFELLRSWRNNRKDLFLVGDPNQAIYGWNGADHTLLEAFLENNPDAKTINLNTNYRSTPEIIQIARTCLPNSTKEQKNKIHVHNPHGKIPLLKTHSDETAEAAAVAETIERSKYTYAETAILVRTRQQLLVLQKELSKRYIPYNVKKDPRIETNPEIQDELEQLLSPTTDFPQAFKTLTQTISTLTASPSQKVKREQLLRLHALADQYLDTTTNPSGHEFQEWIEGNNSNQKYTMPTKNAVDIATFHSCKGLEWEAVHICGLEKGFAPISYATSKLQIEEESRLLYVACTRAKKELYLHWAKTRKRAEKQQQRKPAPVLQSIQKMLTQLQKKPNNQTNWKQHIQKSRAVLPKVQTFKSNENQEKLQHWRQKKARAHQITPQAVLSDQLLQEIADTNVQSSQELLSIKNFSQTQFSRLGKEILNCLDADQGHT